MMRAVVAYVRHPETAAPPEALTLDGDCQRLSCLPLAGGLLEQPAWLLRQMRFCRNAYNAWHAYERKTIGDADWSRRYPDLWAVVCESEQLVKDI